MNDTIQVTCTADPCSITLQVELLPFSMTMEDGGLIAGAVLAVWVVGWGFRILIRVLKETDGTTQPERETET